MMFIYRRTVYYQFHEIKYKISKLKFLLFEHCARRAFWRIVAIRREKFINN